MIGILSRQRAPRLLLAGIFIVLGLRAESQPYERNTLRYLPGTAAGIGLTAWSLARERQAAPLSAAQLAALDRSSIPAWDRPASYHWRPRAARVSDWLLLGAVLAPYPLAALSPDTRRDWPALALLSYQTLSLTYGLTSLIKTFSLRPRPFTYLDAGGNADLLHAQQERDARMSFFSGHTSLSASMCFLGARVYNDYHPRSPSRTWVWIGAATLPAVTGWLRVRAGKHFPSDVVSGYLVGAATGFLMPLIYRRR